MVTATGTFVSCKDYDDDIKDLREQVSKLATKEDMTSQIATLQAALTTAAKDASDAITKATAAETAAKAAGDTATAAKAAAEKAAADAKAEAIKAVQGELDTLKKEVEESTEAALKDMADKVDAATKKVEDIVGKIADMVTSVELILTQDAGDNAPISLDFKTIKEQDNVFGKGLPGEITFVKDTQKQVADGFIVRVSPTNAVLTPDMIQLVNAEGANLNEFLTVTSVSKYKDGIWGSAATPQTRAAAETGLWYVTVELKNYNKDSFNATTMDKIGNTYYHKRFAVAVNNTLSTAETREVISAYALEIDKSDYVPQAELNYWVNDKNVTTIRNRYASTETAAQGGLNVTTGFEELKWTSNTPYTSVKRKSDGTFDTSDTHATQANGTPNDNRSSLSYIYPAVQGEAFTVALDWSGNTSINSMEAPTSAIKAMYVTLDERNAIESNPSEINAWKGYEISGINQVVNGTSVDITINGTNVINDIVGFRVYAVNYDGTLVDPDGRAFYVRLGNAAANWNATATVITPDADVNTLPTAEKSATATVSLTKLTGAATATWTTDKVNNADPAFDVYFVNANNAVVYNTTITSGTGLSGVDFSKVAKVYTMPKVADWTKYEDNKVYNGTLTIKNANDFVLATLEVSMQKVLPTTIPSGFSIKTAQVKDGIYNCYMIPMTDYSNATPAGTATWAYDAAKVGSMPMNQIFNFGDGKAGQYEISFAASAKKNNKDVTVMVAGDKAIEVAKGYIDASTKHATGIVYNYGNISSSDELNNKQDDGRSLGYTVAATDKFETIYNCIYNTTYTWDWATRAQLGGSWLTLKVAGDASKGYMYDMPSTSITYGTDYTLKDPASNAAVNIDAIIFGTSSWDGAYSHMLDNQANKVGTTSTAQISINITEATFTSDANSKQEYFKPVLAADANGFNHITKLEVLPESSNPTADVPSTLNIKYKDMYGHEHTLKVKMTVKQRL